MMHEEQLRAMRSLKASAEGLSAACLARSGVPDLIAPVVKLYDNFILQQPIGFEMTALLGKLK